MSSTILELQVCNHPGVMSHVTGLFARRAFNLEAILCVPNTDSETSSLLLLVDDEPRLEQISRQLEKLHDVISLRQRSDLPADALTRLGSLLLARA
jgi:acetolactate synthase-1/3 small subunit